MTLAALLAVTQAAAAGESGAASCGTPDCCAQCGGRKACQKKVCQVVCEIKKEKKYCWSVQCEDFCAPLPNLPCRECCDKCGGDPAKCGSCCEKCVTPPKCGKVRTKMTLVKKEYEVEKPVYKCVVKYLCNDCCDSGPAEGTPPAAPAAPSQPSGTPTLAPAPMPKSI